MSQPSTIKISSTIYTECHELLRVYTALAAALSGADLSECEVHFKQGSRPAHGISGSKSAMTGYAYFWYKRGTKIAGGTAGDYPNAEYKPNVAPATKYLVTIKLTRDFAYATYPFEISYRWKYKTAQTCVVNDWTEELLHLLVHEFTHVYQYVNHLRRSEIHCEQVAHAAVLRARAMIEANGMSKAARR